MVMTCLNLKGGAKENVKTGHPHISRMIIRNNHQFLAFITTHLTLAPTVFILGYDLVACSAEDFDTYGKMSGFLIYKRSTNKFLQRRHH